MQRVIWWRRSDLNRLPPACKAGALPTELRPLFFNLEIPEFNTGGPKSTRTTDLPVISGVL